jgi:hypothetical protein
MKVFVDHIKEGAELPRLQAHEVKRVPAAEAVAA